MDVINQAFGEKWVMYHGDCVTTIQGIPDNSVHFTVYSPPFSNLYIYSDDLRDMGNSANDAEFFEHYKFLIKDLFRVTLPGRLSAVHCKDLPKYHNRDGAAGLTDFPGAIIRAHEEAGWVYHSRVTIWKDPVTEMQRTKNHGLLHKNFQARGEVCRQGMADYLLVFRKWEGIEGTESTEPVKHNLKAPTPENNGKAHHYVGMQGPESFDSDRDYSIQVWQRYASPVWFDIDQQRVLNFQMAREASDERHICPLQLDVIERAIDLWTNPNDIVLSPFAGIGSEGYCAIKQDRRFIGIELKDSYFDWAIRNLQRAEEESKVTSLFDWASVQTAAD
jgi:DNA modification methylase